MHQVLTITYIWHLNKMEDLKIYGINLIALAFSVSAINPFLQAISLLLAISYTIISIYKKVK